MAADAPGYKPALRKVIALLKQRVVEEPELADQRKYDFIQAELQDLHDWITDDEEHAPCLACGEYAPAHVAGCTLENP
jgi:hypothetical protein